jgi:carbamoyl-phosphate synthase small subunit
MSEADTRALTMHIRTRGAMRGVLATGPQSDEALVRKARESKPLGDIDLVGQVTCVEPYVWSGKRDPEWSGVPPSAGGNAPRRRRVLAYDLGIKRNILRYLADSDCDVTVVPAGFSAAAALELKPDGIFLSNGPGDPETAGEVVRSVRELLGRAPMFGICLGHQILGLALGGSTFKLKFGHRGGNQPVKDLTTNRISITAQNHGYAVDPRSLPKDVETTHVNLNDGTCEGFRHRELPIFAVQYHPESSPGPHDADYLFRRFLTLMDHGRTEPVIDPLLADDLARQISDSKGRRREGSA